MKHTRRVLSILLSLTLLLVLFPSAAWAADDPVTLDCGITVSGGTEGADYAYDTSSCVLTILSETPMTLSGTTTTGTVVVNSDVSANLTLMDLHITSSGSAFKIADDSTGDVTITLELDNTLKSDEAAPGWRRTAAWRPGPSRFKAAAA